MEQYLVVGSQAALGIIRGCLVVTLQADLYDDLLDRIRQGILSRIETRSESKSIYGVIFDLNAVRVLDAYTFNHLADTARMSSLLGAQSVFVGFTPGVVSSLVYLDVDTSQLLTFRSIEEGIEHLTAASKASEDCDNDEEQDEGAEAEDSAALTLPATDNPEAQEDTHGSED